jgi:hypothetical protein
MTRAGPARAARSIVTTLEAKYHRLSRLFPAEWHERHEDALIGTLLDAAEPGRDSVPLAEAVDLIRSAIAVRTRALLARLAVAAPARWVGLAGAALLSVVVVGNVARFCIKGVSAC